VVTSNDKDLKVLIPQEKIEKRVQELARQISADYAGRTVYALCVLENGFMFMSDLVRALEVPVVCAFIKTQEKVIRQGDSTRIEISFIPEMEVRGHDVLLVEGIVQSGVTSEFLIRNMTARGATSVKLAAFLDKSSARRVSLQPDYFGFVVDESFMVGYGLGGPEQGRNLGYVASTAKFSSAAEK
jgi:hypoxanthine phosphoribosyltransferase